MRLKNFLSEAAKFKLSNHVLDLITNVISKKIGEEFYPFGGFRNYYEEFKSSDGRTGVGVRYITPTGKMFRFNWLKGENTQSTFTSVDIWNSLKNLNKPDKTIIFPDDFNIVQSLDAVQKAFTSSGDIELNEDEIVPVKKKRGRPRKIQVTDRETRSFKSNKTNL